MRIEYRVQHVAGREAPLERLLASGLPPAVVVTDEEAAEGDMNPLRGYLKSLADPGKGVTHLCVIQDDTVVCSNFAERLGERLRERPLDLVSLFVGGVGHTKKAFLQAARARQRWVQVNTQSITHCVALVWPVEFASQFLWWFPPDRPIPGTKPPYRSDDMVIGYWAKTHGVPVWATVPCLVEHPDDVPSIAQPDRPAKGQDGGRRAILFVD